MSENKTDGNKITPQFRQLLDDTYQWPAEYMFKFIVPAHKLIELLPFFFDDIVESRPSKNGNYISLTIKRTMQSTDEVIAVYAQVAVIEGLISL